MSGLNIARLCRMHDTKHANRTRRRWQAEYVYPVNKRCSGQLDINPFKTDAVTATQRGIGGFKNTWRRVAFGFQVNACIGVFCIKAYAPAIFFGAWIHHSHTQIATFLE